MTEPQDLFGERAPAPRVRRSAMHGESGYERRELDAYFTETWVTRALLDCPLVSLRGPVWEPAVGRGDMAEEIAAAGFAVIGSDVVDRGWRAGAAARSFVQVDFLACREVLRAAPSRAHPQGRPPAAIVTNPPYGTKRADAESFVRHALALMRPLGGQVAMLLRAEWSHAQSRIPLFHGAPDFSVKIELTRRPRWDWWLPPPEDPDERRKGPRHNYAWYVWDAAPDAPRGRIAWGPVPGEAGEPREARP